MDAAQELIGRHEELSSIVRFVGSLAGGPRALLLEGEAGIGKTALWQAGLTRARTGGQRTLVCRPTGSEVRLSYAALGDLLAEVLEEALPALPVPQGRALQVALLLAEPEEEPPDQRAIGLALLNVLRTLSGSGPLLVAIDDTQWLDQPSAAVLAFALRRLVAEPVGVLATVRLTGGEPPPAALEVWLPAERLRLGPLNLAAVHELLRTRLGVSPSRPTLVRLHQAAGGNPFFALELGRALLEQAVSPHPMSHCRCLPVCVRWCGPGWRDCRRRPASRCWPSPRCPARRPPWPRRRAGRGSAPWPIWSGPPAPR
jgi:predicted ATPase